MSESLQEYYSSYRVSVYNDLFLPNYVQFTKDTIIDQDRTFYDYITQLKLKVEHSLSQGNREQFFKDLITHKNAILGILEKMVSCEIEPSVKISDRGSKFLQNVIGTIGENRWLLPNCSIKNKTHGMNIYIDELRLMEINTHFKTEIIEAKTANPECKIVLMKQDIKTIPIHRLNAYTVLDWTAPLPYECLEDF